MIRKVVEHLYKKPGMGEGLIEIFNKFGDFCKILVDYFLKSILTLSPLVLVEVDDCLKLSV
jgi:hypothetical protein